MAILQVPTMRAKVDRNPRGSATTHVTMAASNPFERGITQVRQANQPSARSMVPGLGGFFDDFSAGFTGEPAPSATPGGADGSATATTTTEEGGSSWGNLFGSITGSITQALTPVAQDAARAYVQKEIGPKEQKPSAMEQMMAAIGMKTLQTPQTTPQPTYPAAHLPGSQITALPGQNPPQPISITVPTPPPSSGGGMTKILPWAIGGVAILAVGGIFLMRRKK